MTDGTGRRDNELERRRDSEQEIEKANSVGAAVRSRGGGGEGLVPARARPRLSLRRSRSNDRDQSILESARTGRPLPQHMIRSEQVERRLARAGLRPRWRGDPPDFFSALRADSRAVAAGDLFCAVPGTQVDGHTFIDAAARAGASAALVERVADVPIPQIVVSDAHAGVAHLAALFEGDPGSGLRLVGITGTNGKSTTAWLTRWILAAEHPTAALGTLGTISQDGSVGSPTLTTPGPIELAETLADLRDSGVAAVAMEVSSHALDQRRVDGLTFEAVAFTSFSREHLEYHPDLESYRTAKLRILERLASGGTCAVNADEPAWNGVTADDGITLRYGLQPSADVHPVDLRLSASGSSFGLSISGRTAAVDLPLPAEFNVLNALAAASVAFGLGLSVETIAERLSSAPPVPGRMEILSRTPVVVIRDFAHNPDSCEHALSTLRDIVPGRVIALLGCGGDRDPGKRPVMGEILTRLSDVAIVTSDNPRSEDPAEICRQMVVGLDPQTYKVVVDRREAIEQAIALAGKDDAVVLLGKGHETTQIIGEQRLPFDESIIVAEILNAGREKGS